MGIKDRTAETFGIALRELRQEANLTQEQLGFDSDLRRTFINVLEFGQQQPTLTTLLKLAPALGVSASELLARVESKLK